MSYGSMETRGVDEEKETTTRVEEQERELDYDVLVETIGEFGWFQKLTCALLWVPAAVGGIHVLMYSFTGGFLWKSQLKINETPVRLELNLSEFCI